MDKLESKESGAESEAKRKSTYTGRSQEDRPSQRQKGIWQQVNNSGYQEIKSCCLDSFMGTFDSFWGTTRYSL